MSGAFEQPERRKRMSKITVLPALAAALLAALAAHAAAEIPGENYVGSFFFLHVDRATVVYPAGPGEDEEANRASAVARARFLERTQGIPTEVASDGAVTPEQRSGHLLLLGWSNRLLGTEEAPRPFARSSDGLYFLGIHESNPTADLLFFTSSPYNRDKALLFWSRIDPDRDRMMPLPLVGSDWAIFQDFRPLCQGMFVRPHTWPPARSPEAEKDHRPEIAQASRNDARRQISRYDVTFDAARFGEQELDAIGRAREAALEAAVAAIGPLPEGYRIALIVFDDEESKKLRVGIPDIAHSLPGARRLFMTRRAARSPSPHEEVHLVARQVLGVCNLSTLYEGLAIAVDGKFRRSDPEILASAMIEQGLFPKLDDLLDEETARALPDEIRYPAAALLARFLLETADRDALRRAYTLREGTAAALGGALRRPAAEVEPAFRAWLDRRLAARANDVAFDKARQRARDRFLAGDWPGTVEELRKAAALRPEDPESLYDLAGAEMRTGEYAQAESHLRSAIEHSLSGKKAQFGVFATFQLGRLFDVQGRREEALVEYRKVLEMPDIQDIRRLAREAIETPVTKESLE